MHNIAEIMNKNPHLEVNFDSVQRALEEIDAMRKAGIATGPKLVRPEGDRLTLHDLKVSSMRSFAAR